MRGVPSKARRMCQDESSERKRDAREKARRNARATKWKVGDANYHFQVYRGVAKNECQELWS